MRKIEEGISRQEENFLYKYGLTLAEYSQMVIDQKGLCAICSLPEVRKKASGPALLCVDHNHTTGKVRGLLCNNCNIMLGHARDNPAFLIAGTSYLLSAK